MDKFRVAINGMGRIGRALFREWLKNSDYPFEIVAVNNPGVPEVYTHLLQYDSVHGPSPVNLKYENATIYAGEKEIAFYSAKDPADIPWEKSNVDIVLDATGVFKDKESLHKHIRGSVKKVIMCAPGKDLDGTFVFGINHKTYDSKNHDVVSNASCTTNCLAPVAKILNDNWEIESGMMTTVHAYTQDQSVLDSSHKDLRRARACGLSMIPTTTGAAKALGLVLPELAGKLDGQAIRVPTPNVSLVDLTVILKKSTNKEEINKVFYQASQEGFKGILGYTDLPLVSIDFNGSPYSSVFDALSTSTVGPMVKVVAWYDNEIGFSNRVLDLANYIGSQL